MIRSLLLASLFLPYVTAQQPPAATGSISGLVLESGTNKPLDEGKIFYDQHGSVDIGPDGHFTITGLAPGTHTVQTFRPRAGKVVQLAAGENLNVELRVTPGAVLTGRILNEAGEPLPKITVFLVAREYRLGSLRYVIAGIAKTDDRGQYSLSDVLPGRGFLLVAENRAEAVNTASAEPADMSLRKRIIEQTWYPGTDSINGAEVLALAPGERRDGTDIKLRRSPSHCIDGTVSGGKNSTLWIEESNPSSGAWGDSGTYLIPPGGKLGDDGKFRICDLHPGSYRLVVIGAGAFFGSTIVDLGEKDVHGLRLTALGRPSVSGEIAWDAKPPEEPFSGQSRIALQPLSRPLIPAKEQLDAAAGVPGQFAFTELLADDYSVRVIALPPNSYVKEITYGGQPILHAPMQVGKTLGSTLRVVLAHDGGKISITLTDKDGKPVSDYQVALLPDSVFTESALADVLVTGQTDQYGRYSTGLLPPGKYFAIASDTPIDKTPECLTRLLLKKATAPAVDLSPNGQAQIALQLESTQ